MGKNRKNKAKAAQTEPETVTEAVVETEAAEAGAKVLSFEEFKRCVASQALNNSELGASGTMAEATRWVQVVSQALIGRSLAGEAVRIPELGTFSVQDRAERNGVNPRTGEKIVIAASKAVVFKAAEPLKRQINGGVA